MFHSEKQFSKYSSFSTTNQGERATTLLQYYKVGW